MSCFSLLQERVGQVDASATFSAFSGALRKVVDRPAAEVGRLPLRNLQLVLLAALESVLDRLDARSVVRSKRTHAPHRN